MLHAPAISRLPARRTLALSLTIGALLVTLGTGLAWRTIRPGPVPVAPATVAGGTLFQISGYKASNLRATNLLLAFTVDGK